MASAQPILQDAQEILEFAHVARREVKRLNSQTRKTARALAQLDEVLQKHGIGLELRVNVNIDTAAGGTEDD